MTTKKTFFVFAGLVALSAIGLAFYPFEKVQAPSPEFLQPLQESQSESIYDQNSRKSLIPPTCQTFFDGCNSCFRTEDGGAACTKMFCEAYQEPRCTDGENQVKNSDFLPACDDTDPLSQCEISDQLEKEKIISREEAKKMILEGKVKSVFQTHNLEVFLITTDGEFSTKETQIDEVFGLIEQCGSLCKDISLATE